MATLTKAQARQLRAVLGDLRAVLAYVQRPETVVARRADRATTVLHYTRPDGTCLYEVTKEIGSDLARLPHATRSLAQFLAQYERP